jgi:uncharacterized surface protein with fasciclin (FAS1) repeats
VCRGAQIQGLQQSLGHRRHHGPRHEAVAQHHDAVRQPHHSGEPAAEQQIHAGGGHLARVGAAGLAETLKGDGPFTVFAPTNAAFAALPAGTVESLLLPENKDKLVSILTYHVVAGKVMSTDLSNDMTATTVQGGDVKIMTEGGVTVNGANVTTADIEASNGVIHVIDAVILPE